MKIKFLTNLVILFIIIFSLLININYIQPETIKAKAPNNYSEILARAIIANQSTYVSSSYSETSKDGDLQGIVLSSFGDFTPTNGSTFVLLSTGIAGANPVTTNQENPGNERGTWFKNRYSKPFDSAVLEIKLQVPPFMNYLHYDYQFFSAEYPEYVDSIYNDKFEVTVYSPSRGTSKFVYDIYECYKGGNFELDSHDLIGTGFDIFAQSGNPGDVDIVDTTPRNPGADAGATVPAITQSGEIHPISPGEIITVTFSIIDVGDNQFDSAVLIDNLNFSGFAKADIIARKSVKDLNGGLCEPNDQLEYTITISNIGSANQKDDTEKNEFEDIIPENTTYVEGSATATYGTVEYDDVNNMIIWNGNILAQISLVIKFKVSVDPDCKHETVISNQGMIFWDDNGDGNNNAIKYTHDPSTGAHEPAQTIISVNIFEPPSNVTEDFSDDTPGYTATQTYLLRKWFNTTSSDGLSSFEVASAKYYDTIRSFKTKIRSITGNLYWYYYLSNLERDIKSWEIWFNCGNASDDADLYLTFKNTAQQEIAKIKFEYTQKGSNDLTDWLAQMYYYNPSTGWTRFTSGIYGNYLYDGWYKLKIERKDSNNINYYLYNSTNTIVGFKTAPKLNDTFSTLEKVVWSSTKNPVVCPIFFWDEHKIELI